MTITTVAGCTLASIDGAALGIPARTGLSAI
jgi:hypothetical protein